MPALAHRYAPVGPRRAVAACRDPKNDGCFRKSPDISINRRVFRKTSGIPIIANAIPVTARRDPTTGCKFLAKPKNETVCKIGSVSGGRDLYIFHTWIFHFRARGLHIFRKIQACTGGTMWASSPTQMFPMKPQDNVCGALSATAAP